MTVTDSPDFTKSTYRERLRTSKITMASGSIRSKTLQVMPASPMRSSWQRGAIEGMDATPASRGARRVAGVSGDMSQPPPDGPVAWGPRSRTQQAHARSTRSLAVTPRRPDLFDREIATSPRDRFRCSIAASTVLHRPKETT